MSARERAVPKDPVCEGGSASSSTVRRSPDKRNPALRVRGVSADGCRFAVSGVDWRAWAVGSRGS